MVQKVFGIVKSVVPLMLSFESPFIIKICTCICVHVSHTADFICFPFFRDVRILVLASQTCTIWLSSCKNL